MATTITNVKSFYTSKTFWSGIISIVTGIAILVQSGGINMTGISAILGGIGAIVGRAQATGPIGLSTYTATTDGAGNVTNGPTFDPLRTK